MTEPLLRMAGISKSFPGVKAVDNVTFQVEAGEVHALLGENGAGKSTLLKILAGAQQPDNGSIELGGKALHLDSPLAAQAAGIVTIYQEFNLIPTMSVAENLFVGREPLRFGLVDWSTMRRECRRIMDQVGLTIEPRRLVSDLSVAEQQMVEIARALSIDSRLIIMDEPTSALSESEVERLFELVSELRGRGIAVIFVTHRLEEVIEICDAVTVLRDGELVGRAKVDDVDVDKLVAMMVGREVDRLFKHRQRRTAGDVALDIKDLTSVSDARDPHATRLEKISLQVRHGEIVGLAGLVGAGRTELARAIFGADPIMAGSIHVGGHVVDISSPIDAIRAGIGLVPEDRKQQALFLALAVRNNLSMAVLERLSPQWGFMRGAEEDELIKRFGERLSIKMASPEQAVGNLSGGNQQKVVLARWLALEPKVLIVDEPTRGIDVAAKADVHQILFELANSGVAILAISSELPEVMTIADRIVTMREGRITGEVDAASATQEELMALMTLSREAA